MVVCIWSTEVKTMPIKGPFSINLLLLSFRTESIIHMPTKVLIHSTIFMQWMSWIYLIWMGIRSRWTWLQSAMRTAFGIGEFHFQISKEKLSTPSATFEYIISHCLFRIQIKFTTNAMFSGPRQQALYIVQVLLHPGTGTRQLLMALSPNSTTIIMFFRKKYKSFPKYCLCFISYAICTCIYERNPSLRS